MIKHDKNIMIFNQGLNRKVKENNPGNILPSLLKVAILAVLLFTKAKGDCLLTFPKWKAELNEWQSEHPFAPKACAAGLTL